MPFVYAASNVLLFPSYQENCPLAPLEAAACGLPVVFRDLKEYSLLYEHPFLKARNNDEFVGIINKLHNDLSFYKEGILISNKLIIQFDRDIIRDKLISLYYDLYNKKLSA
jgi:1,2-diacylglycerol-3-alpha-glucose alpha-1,2-galactosyltransferase